MYLHDFLLMGIAFLSEILGTISGFGSSTFFVPAAMLFEKFKLVLALTAILHCFGNSTKIFLFRAHFSWRKVLPLAIPAVVLTGVGALLTTVLPVELLQRGLGIVLIVLSLFFLFGKKRIKKIPNWLGIVLTALSGFVTGLVGTGGAIRGAALTALHIEKNSFVILSSSIDIGGDLVRMIIYLANGFMDWAQWFYIPMLGLAAFVGAQVGKRLLARVHQNQFEKIVAVFILASGLTMVFS